MTAPSVKNVLMYGSDYRPELVNEDFSDLVNYLALRNNGTAQWDTLIVSGSATFNTAITITPTTNQIILGTTRTVTISAPTPASSSRVQTIPDVGASANFVMSAGTQNIGGLKTFTNLVDITTSAYARSMELNNGDHPTFIQFNRTGYGTQKGSVGALGGFEMNVSSNMDYTTNSHAFYDSTFNAWWIALGTLGLTLQYAPAGTAEDIWLNAGVNQFNIDTTGKMTLAGNGGVLATNKWFLDGTRATPRDNTTYGDSYIYESAANIIDIVANASTSFRFLADGAGPLSGDRIYDDAGGDSYTYESSSNVVDHFVGGTNRLRLNSDGVNVIQDLIVSATNKIYPDGKGDSYIYESAANIIDVFCGGNNILKLDETNSLVSVKGSTDFAVPATQKINPDGGGDTYFTESSANVLDQYAGGTLGIKNASGIITQPAQPCFLVTDAAGATDVTGDGTDYTLVWGTEVKDVGGNFASNTFTAPVTGIYSFSAVCLINNILVTHTAVEMLLITSNRTYRVNRGEAIAAALSMPIVVCASDIDVNDTVTVHLVASGGTKTVDIFGSAQYNYFSGSLIN